MSEIFDAEVDPSGGEPDVLGWSQRRVDGAILVYLAGDLDLATAEELRSLLMNVIESGVEATIVLDLSSVHFIDARSIGVIIGARAAAKVRGRTLLVDGLHGVPAQVFAVLALTPILTVSGGWNGSEGGADGQHAGSGFACGGRRPSAEGPDEPR